MAKTRHMLSGPQRKFCEGIVRGLNATEAYCAAYPNCSEESARSKASRLATKGNIQAEIERLRAKSDEKAGSAVLSRAEKRTFLARVVRCELGEGMPDADLIQSIDVEKKKEGDTWVDIHKVRVCDKLGAIKLDNDLSGEGSEAEANDELAELLKELRK